ncbi:MAG: glycosyltransferase family 9 protein [Candidatus Omnitrophica bacterium]|nr:glycosyltransferase family 9 protein [Candidatus Omnitrophota bacterium]
MDKRILIINPFGIGDVLFSTPLVSAVKEKYPGCHIGYICNIRTKDVLETNPGVDEVFVFERDEYRVLWKESKTKALKKLFNFWKEIRKRRFDLLLDLSLGKEYAFFCWLSGIKARRGFDYKGRGRFLTYRIPFEGFNDKPVVEYYLDAILEWPKGKALNTVLVTTDSDQQYVDDFLKKQGIKESDVLIGVAPGGGASYGKDRSHYKRWPCKDFAMVSDMIVSRRGKPVLLGSPLEEGLLKEVASKMHNKPLFSPKTRIREMSCLINRCKTVLCNDGGLLHVAVSQGVPTVSIFGPTDENVYGPYPASEKHIVMKSNVDCRPCYKRFRLPECTTKRCMEDLSADTVFNTLSKFI